jgi:hypothetical protein
MTSVRKMKLAERISYVGEMKSTPKILVGNTERKFPLEDLSINWKLLLKRY